MISRPSAAALTGIYTTVIVHLVVLIVFLGGRLDAEISKGTEIFIDFSEEEDEKEDNEQENEVEKLQEELAEKEKELALAQAINDRINKRLEEEGIPPARNIPVNMSNLKDDRHSAEETEDLYKHAEELAKELEEGPDIPQEEVTPIPAPKKEEKKKETREYSGPSILAYELEGRTARYLPIPAYRGYGAGQVKVIIVVDRQGKVVNATVDKSCSSADKSLQYFAINAAKKSRFSLSNDAPEKQSGYIIYKFVAQ